MSKPRNTYRKCTACGAHYLGDTKCTECGDTTGKSMDQGGDITKKTFDAPDLMKAH